MKKPSVLNLFFIFCSFQFFISEAQAALLITTSGTGANGDIEILIPEATFLLTSDFAGGTLAILIDEALPASGNDRSDGIWTGPDFEGGTVLRYTDSGFNGVDITPNDPYIIYSSVDAFTTGETMHFSGGSISMTASNAAVDLFSSGSYDVFLTDGSGIRISDNGVATIPEASSLVLMVILFFAAGCVLRKCR